MGLFDWFSNSKKKSQNSVNAMPVRSLQSLPSGVDYYNAIKGRAQGQGVGYGDAYTSNANPQIAQLHNAYTNYELPALNSELTATGRRRGSSGFQQIAQSQSGEADKENAIMARLMQNNAEASHSDVNNAIDATGRFAQNEANMANQGAAYDRQANQEQLNNESTRLTNESAGANRLGQLGLSLGLAPFTSGASLSMMGVPQADPYQEYIKSITQRMPQPNYSALTSPGYNFSVSGQSGRIR